MFLLFSFTTSSSSTIHQRSTALFESSSLKSFSHDGGLPVGRADLGRQEVLVDQIWVGRADLGRSSKFWFLIVFETELG